MHYFFDESGNWSGYEKKRLVLGGLIVPNIDLLNRLFAEFSLLRSTHGLSYLHAAEMSDAAREEIYHIIVGCLAKGARAILRIYPCRTLFRSTRMTFEEVYMDLAASLVGLLIMGDDEPSIFYDMKFHYAYPLKIIDAIRYNKPYYYHRIMAALTLKEDELARNKARIIAKIDTIKHGSTINLDWYMAELANNEKKAVTDYLWSELVLQVQGKEQARELFRAQILSNLKSMTSQLKTLDSHPVLKIDYLAKDNENAGIEMIDFLNNLVYRYGSTPHSAASSTVKKIYSLMTVQETRA